MFRIKTSVIDKNAWVLMSEYFEKFEDMNPSQEVGLNEEQCLGEDASRKLFKTMMYSIRSDYFTKTKKVKTLGDDDSESQAGSEDDSDLDESELLKKRAKLPGTKKALEAQIEQLKKKNNELLELCHIMEMS